MIKKKDTSNLEFLSPDRQIDNKIEGQIKNETDLIWFFKKGSLLRTQLTKYL